jgi:hypothetical protein
METQELCSNILIVQNYLINSPETKNKMATILDQKNYLEELNRHLK